MTHKDFEEWPILLRPFIDLDVRVEWHIQLHHHRLYCLCFDMTYQTHARMDDKLMNLIKVSSEPRRSRSGEVSEAPSLIYVEPIDDNLHDAYISRRICPVSATRQHSSRSQRERKAYARLQPHTRPSSPAVLHMR